MALINWNDSLSVNVAEIDQQHIKLIAMINELNEAMKKGQGNDVLGKIVSNLVSYTETHFKFEEKYFAKFGYPDTNNHKKEHAAFIQKASEFKDKLEKKKISITIELMNFLSDWLKTHIMKTDKNYTKFFNENGLQ